MWRALGCLLLAGCTGRALPLDPTQTVPGDGAAVDGPPGDLSGGFADLATGDLSTLADLAPAGDLRPHCSGNITPSSVSVRNGTVTTTYTGAVPGATYNCVYTTDLQTWVTYQQPTADSGGTFICTISPPPGPPAFFNAFCP